MITGQKVEFPVVISIQEECRTFGTGMSYALHEEDRSHVLLHFSRHRIGHLLAKCPPYLTNGMSCIMACICRIDHL